MFEGMPEEKKEEMRQCIEKYGQKARTMLLLAKGMKEEPFDAMVALMIKKHAKEQHRDIMKVLAEVKKILITDSVVEKQGSKDDVIKEVMDIMSTGGNEDE